MSDDWAVVEEALKWWAKPLTTQPDSALALAAIARLRERMEAHHRVGYGLNWGEHCPICDPPRRITEEGATTRSGATESSPTPPPTLEAEVARLREREAQLTAERDRLLHDWGNAVSDRTTAEETP